MNTNRKLIIKITFCFMIFSFINISAQISPLKAENFLGKKMVYDYGSFSVDIVINSDSTLYWKDRKTGKDGDEKTVTIHLDDYTTIVSWLEGEGDFVTVYSDFRKSRSSAIIYKPGGEIIPVSGSIKLTKKFDNDKAAFYQDDLNLEELLK